MALHRNIPPTLSEGPTEVMEKFRREAVKLHFVARKLETAGASWQEREEIPYNIMMISILMGGDVFNATTSCKVPGKQDRE